MAKAEINGYLISYVPRRTTDTGCDCKVTPFATKRISDKWFTSVAFSSNPLSISLFASIVPPRLRMIILAVRRDEQ